MGWVRGFREFSQTIQAPVRQAQIVTRYGMLVLEDRSWSVILRHNSLSISARLLPESTSTP